MDKHLTNYKVGFYFFGFGVFANVLALVGIYLSENKISVINLILLLFFTALVIVLIRKKNQIEKYINLSSSPGEFNNIEVSTLISGLESKNPVEQVACAKELSEMNDPNVVKELTWMLKNPRESVLNLATETIIKICQKSEKTAIEHVVEALRFDTWEALDKTNEILEKLGEGSVEPLIAVLGDTNYQVQKNARQILERIKRPAVEPLINALKDGNEDTRRNSAMVLGTIKDPRAIEPLIKTLKDKCEYVRAEAYFSLIDITKNFDLKENFAECMNWWQENKGKFLKNK